MITYIKNNVILFILIIALSIIVTYYRRESIMFENKVNEISSKMLDYKNFFERTIGKEFGEMKLYSLKLGKELIVAPKYSYIIYGSNKGCKKCLTDIFEAISKLPSQKIPIVVISANSIMEFIPYKDVILKSDNIFWDKNDLVLSLLGEDRRKSPPVLIKIKKGLIVQYNLFDKLSIINDLR